MINSNLIRSLVEEAFGAQHGTHASNHETAFRLAVRQEAVKLARIAGRDAPAESSHEHHSPRRFAEKYPDGVMGLAPLRATAELGRAIRDRAVDLCVQELRSW